MDDADDVIKIDETDKKILNLLNRDGRMSYRKISRELNISVGTVHNRVDKFMNQALLKNSFPR